MACERGLSLSNRREKRAMDKSMSIKEELFYLVITTFMNAGLNLVLFSIALGYWIINKIFGKR